MLASVDLNLVRQLHADDRTFPSAVLDTEVAP
jgi:hypothetical protein